MDLLEDHFLVGTMQCTPAGDMALERAQLVGLIAPRMALTQELEQRLGLQRGIALELGVDPGPVGGEGVGAGALGARCLELAGERAGAQVLAGGGHAHPSPSGRLVDGFPLMSFTEHALHLAVRFHWAPSLAGAMLRGIRRWTTRRRTESSDCRRLKF